MLPRFQAETSRDALRSAQETAERQLRAYIYLENAYYEFTRGVCEITFRIKNFGSTPAHRVTLSRIAEVVDWNNGSPEIPTPPPDEETVLGSMAPNGDFFDRMAVRSISRLCPPARPSISLE